jgi:Fic family protein
LRQLWQKFLESLKGRKAKRLEKILQLAKEKGQITNDDVEKHLHVSDKTATRYLNELVRGGKLKRLDYPFHAKYQIP